MIVAKHDFTEIDIPVSELEIDRRVQRDHTNRGKVEEMVRNYNPSALGRVAVNERDRVTKVVVDGGHRWEVVRIVTDNKGTIPSMLFKKLTLAEEAQLFRDLNFNTKVPKIDTFKVGVVAGDKMETEIDKLVHSYGYAVAPYGGTNIISCVGALERIWSRSEEREREPNLLQLALLTVNHTWGGDAHGLQAPVLEALAAVYDKYGTERMDPQDVVAKLREYEGGLKQLTASYKQLSITKGIRPSMALAELIVITYNKGRSSKKLPGWDQRSW